MAYTAAALAEGAGSSLSVPLVLEGEAEAALKMYSTDPTAALESRTIIDLAAGAIMAQNRCSQNRSWRRGPQKCRGLP